MRSRALAAVHHALCCFHFSFASGCTENLQSCRILVLPKLILNMEICQGKNGSFHVLLGKKLAIDWYITEEPNDAKFALVSENIQEALALQVQLACR